MNRPIKVVNLHYESYQNSNSVKKPAGLVYESHKKINKCHYPKLKIALLKSLVSSMAFNINGTTQQIWHILYFMVRLE